MYTLYMYCAWCDIERFSLECRKVIGFAFTTLRDSFKKLTPLFHPIRSKTKTNRDSLVRVFTHFVSATCTCNYFMFWLVHLIICVLCDWLEWLLWSWFYDTQLKTTLITCTCTCVQIKKLSPIPGKRAIFCLQSHRVDCHCCATRYWKAQGACFWTSESSISHEGSWTQVSDF